MCMYVLYYDENNVKGKIVQSHHEEIHGTREIISIYLVVL